MNITLFDTSEIFVGEGMVTFLLPMPMPVARGQMDVCLSVVRAGTPAAPTLARTLRIEAGVGEAFSVFAKDIRTMMPRGGRAWIVVRYAGEVIGIGEVRLIV